MVRRFLITVNWPRSKLRLTGHGQDIFSPKFYHRVQIHCSRRPALNGDRESWKTPLWETVFSGQGGEIVTKGTVSIINRATRVNAHRSNWIEGGRGKKGKKKFRDAFRFEFQTFVPFFLPTISSTTCQKRSFTSYTFELPILNFDSPVRGFCFTCINRIARSPKLLVHRCSSVYYVLVYTCYFHEYISHLIDHLRQFSNQGSIKKISFMRIRSNACKREERDRYK